MIMDNKELLVGKFLARDLHVKWFARRPFMNKKVYLFLVCFFLASMIFLYPFSNLQDDYIAAAPLIAQDKEITLSEPAVMFLLGSGLIGMGIYTKRRFYKKGYKP
jgi:hypothetical protein